ncbi:hypothetical protein MANES_15G184500v8 [Manihot esculenta]|uniref:Uncharacterized protein n=1 Tax=Manihot esculenta TaxID=3983 RepID=A0ACB7GCQ4_MANES|nr:hypothetical protein MANES_15G184500v8 [Manihot esculenta]
MVSLLESKRKRKTSLEEKLPTSNNHRKKAKHDFFILFLLYSLSKFQVFAACFFVFFFCFIIIFLLLLLSSSFTMEKHQYGLLKEEVKLDNELCYLPESRAFSYGIAAVVCLVIAQIIANLVICSNFWLRKDGDSSKAKKPIAATAFLVLSWISFVLAFILLSAATSMSRKQLYGKGWLDQKCYIAKDGVFIGSGILVLVSITTTIGAVLFTIRKVQSEQGRRIHTQFA